MKYKVGDIVKLRDDLEVGKKYGGAKVGGSLALAIGKKGEIKGILTGQYHIKFSSKHGGYHFVSDEMIEGLWEECKSTEQVSKSEDSSVNSSVKKYKLIDILNKIANGELKEGTKVVRKEVEGWGNLEYTYINGDLEREGWNETIYLYEEMYGRHLNEEVELIEPNDFPDVGKMTEQFREDTKMIEPTDNTKIEELEWHRFNTADKIFKRIVFDKLNEVIRYINKED